jgi:hypothetical protein
VHVLLHRLMLQLLARHFPGSYLVTADPGQMRYTAAFRSATAAAAWGLTLEVRGAAASLLLHMCHSLWCRTIALIH